MESNVTLWKGNSELRFPSELSKIEDIVNYGAQLSQKDRRSIVSAFKNGNYQMLSTYVWSKTITSLKNQLSKMGSAFIGEMLNRPDINETTSVQHAITDFEAIQLAEELGIISGSGAFRMKQAFDLITYFNTNEIEEDAYDFSKEDAITIVKSSIQSILGYEKIDIGLDFKDFRDSLENNVLNDSSPIVQNLSGAPYFFQMATIRILLALIKTRNGAQLDNVISNGNLIIPKLWNSIRQPEKWQVGRCYAELFSDGKTIATNGLRDVLLKVKGFDFVPEDLRSTSFIKVANEILKVHSGVNNYYNEPPLVISLRDMGSSFPMPAFPICMTAVLSVRLGNMYGTSWAAQEPVLEMLSKLTLDKWRYYFDECLRGDELVLRKLEHDRPRSRWIELINSVPKLSESVTALRDKNVKSLIIATMEGKHRTISGEALGMLRSRAS